MLLLAAAIALAAPSLPEIHSWLSVGQRQGVPAITMVESKAENGIAAELQGLLAQTKSQRLQCLEIDEAVLCTVILEDIAELYSVEHNFGHPGHWSVAFKGQAAAELHAALGQLEPQRFPEGYVSSASGRIICETEEMACVIRN